MSTHTAPYGALAGAGLAELAERVPTSTLCRTHC
jgi:hypothetical protein